MIGTIVLAGAACGLDLVHPALISVPVLIWIWLIAFFRDPQRPISQDKGVYVSPADGMVSDITDMPQCDVVLVLGANDVVNPAARYDKTSPIYGMPIIDADKAKTVFAVKRSKNPGFAGIENELYFSDKTWMLFGDAKVVVGELVKQLSGGGMC